jgi:hypothetical protein
MPERAQGVKIPEALKHGPYRGVFIVILRRWVPDANGAMRSRCVFARAMMSERFLTANPA